MYCLHFRHEAYEKLQIPVAELPAEGVYKATWNEWLLKWLKDEAQEL